MKPFVYRFERKLGLVRQEELSARQELHLLIMERDRIAEELDHLKNRIVVLQESIRSFQGNPLQPEVELRKTYLPVLKDNFLMLVETLQEAEARVETARRLVMEKNRETKTFEKLRERDWQGYIYELNREEQKIIDEVAVTSRSRKLAAKQIGTGL